MKKHNKSNLESYTVYVDNLDMRTVKCSCKNPNCKIGLSFDSEPSVMRLTDKFGNEHAMHLDNKNIRQVILELKSHIKK